MSVFDLLGVEKVCTSVELSYRPWGFPIYNVISLRCDGGVAVGGAVYITPMFVTRILVDDNRDHCFARRFSNKCWEIIKAAGAANSQLGTLFAASINAANIKANAYVISFQSDSKLWIPTWLTQGATVLSTIPMDMNSPGWPSRDIGADY